MVWMRGYSYRTVNFQSTSQGGASELEMLAHLKRKKSRRWRWRRRRHLFALDHSDQEAGSDDQKHHDVTEDFFPASFI